MSQEAFSVIKVMCSSRIQTRIFRKTSVTAAGIFSHALRCKQAAHTQNCHQTISPAKHCICNHAR